MKIGLFTDSHYSSREITCGNRYNSRSLQKIKDAYAYFREEKCDLVISLGDLIDREDSHEKEISNLKQIADVIAISGIETVCVMGNHDGFAFTEDDFYGILGGCRPENRISDGRALIFIDACYFKSGKHYMPGDKDWTDTFFPYEEELKKTLEGINGEVYIFMHQNLDPHIPQNHRLANADALCGIIEQSGKVKAVYQGHYHKGHEAEKNSVRYITLPAMCENDNAVFTVEVI